MRRSTGEQYTYEKEAVIRCGNIRANLEAIHQRLNENCGLITVIKGDGYGHGIIEVARQAEKMPYVKLLAVASLEEARSCIRAGISKQILILYQVREGMLRRLFERIGVNQRAILADQCVFSVYTRQDFDDLLRLGQDFGLILQAHLRLDFFGGVRGMGKAEFRSCFDEMMQEEHVRIEGIYSHIYSTYHGDGGERDLEQYAQEFNRIPPDYRKRLCLHLLTSVCFWKYPQYMFDCVRVGAALYGLPLTENDTDAPKLQPAMSIRAVIMNIVEVQKYVSMDYIGEMQPDVTRVALLEIGSWDIPHFFLGDCQTVIVCGQKTRIVGSPCMDSCCVDISRIEQAKIGDIVYIMDEQDGVTLSEKIKENNYSISNCQMLFAGMNRLPKVYLNETEGL